LKFRVNKIFLFLGIDKSVQKLLTPKDVEKIKKKKETAIKHAMVLKTSSLDFRHVCQHKINIQ
jgi:hypothetical protein